MKYRKKVATGMASDCIEALQFVGNFRKIAFFAGSKNLQPLAFNEFGHPKQFFIYATSGGYKTDYGDWVIKSANGELSSCKPDIFDMTYEEVKE